MKIFFYINKNIKPEEKIPEEDKWEETNEPPLEPEENK